VSRSSRSRVAPLFACLLAVAFATPLPARADSPPVSPGNWPQYRGGPARQGVNPFERSLDPSNVSGLHVVWSATTGGPIESSPAVAKGTLYIGSDDGSLYAFGAKTGAIKWQSPTGGPVFGSPAVSGGKVFDTSGDNHLYAFDAKTGSIRWSVDLGGFAPTQTSPAVVHRSIYATSGTQTVFAIHAATGAIRWSRSLIYLGCDLDLGYSPSVAHGKLFQTGCGIPLTAMDARTGDVLWETPDTECPNSGPAVSVGVAYYPTCHADMQARDASTGSLRWATPGPAVGVQLTYPAVGGGMVYEASYDETGNPGYLTAWDAGTGVLQWVTTLPCGSIYSSPTIANGVVYVGYGGFDCPGGLAALDATTGDILFETSFGGGSSEMRSSPTVVKGMVYIGTDQGTVLALGL
jgi:outer membrane protein assembly factor BamB